MTLVGTFPGTYPIRPNHINADRHLFDSFGNRDREISAGWIVRFCQRRESWEPFTAAELNAYYNDEGRPEIFWFNDLDTRGLIVLKEGMYHLMHEFVARCFLASPAIPS